MKKLIFLLLILSVLAGIGMANLGERRVYPLRPGIKYLFTNSRDPNNWWDDVNDVYILNGLLDVLDVNVTGDLDVNDVNIVGDLTLEGLTASRLLYLDADSNVASVADFTDWIAGTANEIDITDDTDGTVTIGIINPLIVGKGGTGAATFTDGGVLLGSGTSAFTAMAVLGDGEFIVGDGTTDPVAESGNTARTSLGLGTGDSPTFTGLTLSDLTATRVLFAGTGGLISDDTTFNFNSTTKVLDVDGQTITGTIAIGLDMSGGTFATAVQNWPTNPIIQAGGAQVIKFNDTNFNVFVGTEVFNNDDGQYNVGLGYRAGYNNEHTTGTTGYYNVYIGNQAGFGASGSNNTGQYNFGLGSNALYNNTDGRENVAIGAQALYNNTTGDYNIAIGLNALFTSTAAPRNIAMGREALKFTTGQENTGIGHQVLKDNRAGSYNLALGSLALTNNVGADGNIGIGYASFFTNTEGEYNTAVGYYTGRYNQTGSYNIYIGAYSGGWNAGGTNNHSNNTVIGSYAGYNITTGGGNVFLGFKSGYNQTSNSDRLIIDNQDRGSAAAELTDCLIYGVYSATPASQSLRFNVGTTNWHNATHEDTDGGRESILNFKGQQSGGEETTLARIEISHDGAADDQLGKEVHSINTGAGLVNTMTLDSSLDASFTKIKLTSIGGYAIKLTNKTGANSVAGELVNAHTSVENAVEQSATDDTIPIGAFLDSGITDGSEAWVVVGGIAQVLVDGSTTVAVGDWVKVSSNDAGRCESSGSEAPGLSHFREIGHALEGGGNNELIKIAMHFN